MRNLEKNTQEIIDLKNSELEIFCAVRDYMYANCENDFKDKTEASWALTTFGEKEGAEAIKAMYGFIRYVANHPEDTRFTRPAIRAMFIHDLNGAGTRGFLPRTSGYLKYAEV